MSEPNTSEPLHSSWTRQVILVLGSASLFDVTKQINRRAADRRQEDLKVGPRDQFGEHAGGLFKQSAPQPRFGRTEALGDAGQIPHRIDGDF